MKERSRVLASLAVVLAAACAPEPPGPAPPPRLVVLYAPCTVNKHTLAPYDSAVPFTPALAAFARQAVVFDRHMTEAGQSGIAYASLLSGAQADRHGIYRHPMRLADSLHLLTEAFAEQGYEPFFWNGHPFAGPQLNYDQGVAERNSYKRMLRAGDPRFTALLKHLVRNPQARAFVVTNFTVTHGPYPLPPFTRFLREHAPKARLAEAELLRWARLYREHHHALSWSFPETVRELGLSQIEVRNLVESVDLLYRANVQELDRLFGELVAAIDSAGLRDASLVAFTADHGEVLFRESAPFQWSHSMQLAPEVLGVPWLVRSPRLAGGRHYEAVTRSMDVYPTLLGLAGFSVAPERGVDGADLSAALLGHEPPPELRAWSHTTVLVRGVFKQMRHPKWSHVWQRAARYFPDEDPRWIWAAVRDGDRFLELRRPPDGDFRFEAFDLATDPGELRDLFDSSDPEQRGAAAELAAYKERLVAGFRGRARRAPLPAGAEERMLRSLGYIR